jgi:hypothetical protein
LDLDGVSAKWPPRPAGKEAVYHDNRPSFYNAIPILHLDPGHFNIRDQRFIGAHSGAAMTRGGKALAIEA